MEDASAKHAAPRNASNAYSSPSIRFSTCLHITVGQFGIRSGSGSADLSFEKPKSERSEFMNKLHSRVAYFAWFAENDKWGL
jgi:hypothetical protein